MPERAFMRWQDSRVGKVSVGNGTGTFDDFIDDQGNLIPKHSFEANFPNQGGEFLDDGARMVEQPFSILPGAVKSNYNRFVKSIPANSKSSASWQHLENGDFLFEATSLGKVLGSSALYQKWVNPKGETFQMLKTTFAPDGSIIHIKPKM